MKKGIDAPGVCVVFYCHDGKGNFIMGKRSKTVRDERGGWDLGGGVIEFGETAEEALKREIKEEYGTGILQFEFLGYRDALRVDHNKNKTHWVALDFKVLINREKIQNNAPDALEEIGWFTLDNLPTPIHSQMPIFLKKYKKRLVAK